MRIIDQHWTRQDMSYGCCCYMRVKHPVNLSSIIHSFILRDVCHAMRCECLSKFNWHCGELQCSAMPCDILHFITHAALHDLQWPYCNMRWNIAQCSGSSFISLHRTHTRQTSRSMCVSRILHAIGGFLALAHPIALFAISRMEFTAIYWCNLCFIIIVL